MAKKTQNNIFSYIQRYARSEALRNRVLIDISELAATLGFVIPVALTSTAWLEYIETPPNNYEKKSQQERLVFLLDALYFEIQHTGVLRSNSYIFSLKEKNKQITFQALCHGGDQGEPVLTILSWTERPERANEN